MIMLVIFYLIIMTFVFFCIYKFIDSIKFDKDPENNELIKNFFIVFIILVIIPFFFLTTVLYFGYFYI